MAIFISSITNPVGAASIVHAIFGPLHLEQFLLDYKAMIATAFIISSLSAYTIRVTIGRQFKSQNYDLPEEALEAYREREILEKMGLNGAPEVNLDAKDDNDSEPNK